MKNEKIYSIFGQVLVFSVLVLVSFSVYWGLSGLAEVAAYFVQEETALWVPLLGAGVLVMIARRSVSAALIIILTIAGLDRLNVVSSYHLANSLVGGLCLVMAFIMFVGILSERWKFASKVLPNVLMIFLGLVFLAPVAVIARVLGAMRILPTKSDDRR